MTEETPGCETCGGEVPEDSEHADYCSTNCGLVAGATREELRSRRPYTDGGYDTTEKLERTDVGFRLTIESTRGTGTRDQDKVKAELRTEDVPELSEVREIRETVEREMKFARMNQPDGEDDE